MTIKAFVSNKSNKIWLNYSIGVVLSAILIYSIYTQVEGRFEGLSVQVFFNSDTIPYLIAGICLMPVNISLEILKWHYLTRTEERKQKRLAIKSYFAGVAFSIITPNRIGEYPARIVYLKQDNKFRLISASILGVVAQMLAVSIAGLAGLIYYNIVSPSNISYILLAGNIVVMVALFLIYLKYDVWMRLLGHISWLKKYHAVGKMLSRFDTKQQLTILMISIARFAIYTAQYLIFLYWMHISIPVVDGLLLSALFFWVMSLVPSIAFTELGARGKASILLFGLFSTNTIGILTATFALWLMNIIVPSIIGSMLIMKTRLIR